MEYSDLIERFHSVKPHRLIVTPDEAGPVIEMLRDNAEMLAESHERRTGEKAYPINWCGPNGLPLFMGEEIEIRDAS